MSRLLLIETSGEFCSVGLFVDGMLVKEVVSGEPMEHSRLLATYVEQVMGGGVIDGVVVDGGPGSYTGLRIGLSLAKGLCYGLSVPLVAVGSLSALLWGYVAKYGIREGVYMAPMIDARRMEVYTAVYNDRLELVEDVKPMVVDGASMEQYRPLVVFGSGGRKVLEVMGDGVEYVDVELTCSGLAKIGEQMFTKGEFVDLAYFEPYYLKEWVGKR